MTAIAKGAGRCRLDWKSAAAAQAFSFAQAADAHRLSEQGHVRGKLVLIPDGE